MKKKGLLVSLLALLLCCILLTSCMEKKTVTGISVAGVDGMTFEVGHELTLADFADMTVSVEYSDAKHNKTLSLKDASALPEGLTISMIGQTVVAGDNTVTVRYRESDITKTATFTIRGIAPEVPEFEVTYPSAGVTVDGPATVRQGEDLSFTVTVMEGYRTTAEGLKVFANGNELSATDGSYRVANVQANVEITVTGVEPIPGRIEVYAPDVEGVIFGGAETVEIGSDYVFTISLEAGYTKAEDFCVKVNGEVVSENESGEYVVKNVSGEFSITVTGVKVHTLNVTFEGIGFITPEVLTVRFGGNYSFSVSADPNYSDSASQMKVYRIDGETKTELTSINGTYVIENVTADLTILVEGLLPNTYSVTPPEAMGVRFEGAGSAVVGETYTFRITIKDGYFPGPGFEVYALCSGEKVTATQNAETGAYEFVVSGVPAVFVDGVYRNAVDVPMAQWPDENSVQLTEIEEVPEGYNRAFTFTMGWQWGYRTNLANVDISNFSALSFKIRALDLLESGSFHLYQGENYLKNFYYADTDWHEIVLTKNSAGGWTMTADGAVLEGVSLIGTNLKDLFNFSLGNTVDGEPESHFQVTSINGVPLPATIRDGYEEVIDIPMAQWPDDNSVEVTESVEIPNGYTKAYAFTMGWQWGYRTNLANVDISQYTKVSLMIRALDLQNPALFHLYQGDTYLKNFYYADTTWHEIVLTKNDAGVWSMTVDGTAVSGFASTETNLKDVFNFSLGNSTEGCPDSHFQVTHIIGIRDTSAPDVPVEPVLTDITVSGMDGAMFEIGHELTLQDLANLTVVLIYSDTTKNKTISIKDLSALPEGLTIDLIGRTIAEGENIVTVSYQDGDVTKQTTFTVVGTSSETPTYSVTYPTEGVTTEGPISVQGGETLRFTVTVKEGYKETADGLKVFANGTEISATNGEYVVEAVSGNIVITVTGVRRETHLYDGYKEVIDKPMAQWPDENSVEITECDEIPDGYIKAYAFTMGYQWGYRTNLANVDISKYTTVSFMIRALDLQNPALFHLYQGDTYLKNFYYADTNWHEIVLTKDNTGTWTMTADGTAVEGFTSTATNLKDMFNFSLGNTTEGCPDSHFQVTHIIGIPMPPAIKDGYQEVIDKPMAQWPDENSVEITECDEIPDGYTKAYAFTMGWQWGYRTNLANVDISKYTTVSFMIRALDLQDPALFHLYQGDTYLKNFYYADTSWHEIVLTQDSTGTWTMTADGTAVEAFSSTATNLKDMFNFSLGNTTAGCPDSHFQVTHIIGIPTPPAIKDGYQEVIDKPMAQWPDENSVEITECDEIPDGYTKAYAFTMGYQWGYRTNLANVDISKYTTVSFMIRALDLQDPALFHLFQGDTYLKNFYYADTSWHEIVLTKDSTGTWTMTADGTAVEGFTSTATNLKDMFNFSLGNTTEGCPDSHFQVTHIIGIPTPPAINDGYEEVIDKPMAQWPDENSVEITECDEIPDGYTKAYAFTMGWQWGYHTNIANVDISKYTTVSFMIRALDLQEASLFHLYQGDTYLKNFYYADTNWHEIVLTKDSEGVWTMTADGTAVEGFTSTATNLKDMFNFSLGNTTEGCPDSHFQATHIIGIPTPPAIKDGYEEIISNPMAQWPDDNSNAQLTEIEEVPEGYTKAYAFAMGWQWGYRTNLANVDISKYTTVSFMIRALDLQEASLFHLYQGDTYLKNFYYADTSWHEIVLTKDSTGTWTMTADGAAVEAFSSTATNLKDMFNFSLGNSTEGCPNANFQVTHIIGVLTPPSIKDGYEEVISNPMAQWPDDNSNAQLTEIEEVPEGYTKAYAFTMGWQWGYRTNLANVDISQYATVSFMIRALDLQEASVFHLYQGDTYLKNFYYADTSWHEIVLTKDSTGTWTMTADGAAVEAFSSTATNLKDMFNFSLGNSTEGCPNANFRVTNIIGASAEERALSFENADAIALTSSDGSEAEYAAVQLKKYLYESTGRDLEILHVSNLSELSGKRCIVLGSTLAPAPDGLTTDTGYAWKLDRNHLYIYGRTHYGTLNGVLAFMNAYLGLEFFSDTTYTISRVDNFTFETDAQTTFNPSIEYNWADGGLLMTKFWESYGTDADYARLLGFQQAVFMSGANWHNFTTLISQEKYASAHPEWFRTETDKNDNTFVTLDLSYNDFEMCETVADELLALILSDATTGNYRNRTIYTFSAPDHSGWSTSETSQALKAKYGTESAEYILFMKKVADRLEEKLNTARLNGQIDDRTITLVLLAYNNTLAAPTYENADAAQITYSEFVSSMSLGRSEDSFVKLSVMYAPIEMSYQQAITDDTYSNYTASGITNKYYADNLLAWKALNPDGIAFWNYAAYYTNYFTPLDTISHLRETYRFLAENGVTVMFDGGQLGDDVSTNFEALKVYLRAKVAQNVYMTDEEFDQAIEDFCMAYYGAGGAYMKQLILAIMDWYPTVTERSSNVAGAGHGGSWLAHLKECWDEGETNLLGKTTYDSSMMLTWYGYILSALDAVENDTTLTEEEKQIILDHINTEGISIRFMLAFTYGDKTYGDVNAIIADAKALGISLYAEGKNIDLLGEVWEQYGHQQ